jgi:uncharacterized protein YraI
VQQLPARTGQSERQSNGWRSYRTGWLTMLVSGALLLVIIVLVATFDGMRIAAREQALKSAESNLPIREQVYSGSIPAPPTVVTAPQPDREVVLLDPASVVPTLVAIPEPEVGGFVATVKTQETVRWLHSGPGTQYAVVRELVPGERVILLVAAIEIKGQPWQLVRTSDDQVGWCMTHWLATVRPGG